jgi:hypothetical protein
MPELSQIADALEAHFKTKIENGFALLTGKHEPFEKTGVALPRREIWEGYARAVVGAIDGGSDV